MKIRKVEKLVPNPKDLKDVSSTRQALQLSKELTKVHWVILEQSCWMKPYIMLDTSLRTAANHEKVFFERQWDILETLKT